MFPPFKARVKRISCKTLIINGGESALWLRRIGELTASSIPNAERAKISGARHFPHIENASDFNERVMKFLSAAK
jgi:pimeloyl-ACP methyl ester carboxylesterase